MPNFREKKLDEILKGDFISAQQYTGMKFINLETEGICECDKYCSKEGVCRAFTITNTIIESIDLEQMSYFIWRKLNNLEHKNWQRNEKLKLLLEGYDQTLDIYCIERILRSSEIYHIDSWKVTYRVGYYGQEIASFNLDEQKQIEISERVNKLLQLKTLKEKCHFLLNLEYGYILNHLKDCTWSIETINKDKVIFPQIKHYNKVKKSKLYKNRKSNNIMGICLKEGETYKLIDGYNRISQTKNKTIVIITANYELTGDI